MSKPHPAEKPRPASRARLLLPALAAGLGVALIALLVMRGGDAVSVSDVQRAVRSIALTRNENTGREPGGSLGPWHIAAQSADTLTGEFSNFRIASGNMHIAARRAMLIVDAKTNSISFEMWDVAYAYAPLELLDVSGDGSHFLHRADHYVLGPAPYFTDIVPDGGDMRSVEPTVAPPSIAQTGIGEENP